MSLFGNINTDANIKAETDSVGGSRTLESGLYDFKIDLAYVSVSAGGARAVNFHFKGANGEQLRQAIYFTSGTAKGGKNTYTDKQGKEQFLPGYNAVNSICLLTVGKPLVEMAAETKTVKLWDFEASKELPKEVPVLVDLLDQDITLGVIKQIVDKNAKNDQGVYVPTGETREENELDKAFRADDGLTFAEISAGETEAKFKTTWAEKWAGQVRNKAKGAAAGGATAGAPGASAAAAPTKSLFGNK